MTTLAPSAIKLFSEDSIQKKVYNLTETFQEFLPLPNDRNRLAFALLNYLKGEGDSPIITVRNNKLTLEKITKEELAKKIEIGLADINK
jgi:hypothetical protein